MHYKQLGLSILALFIAVQIPFVTAYAQIAVSPARTSSAAGTIDYQLAYPGLLPDNPLYFLKVIRDNLTAFFVSKPLDKASFDLLQSDKEVEASYLLVTQEQGKNDLALRTITQSQDYFADAIKQTTHAKQQGYSIMDMSKKLQEANRKHLQIVQAIGREIHQEKSQIIQNQVTRERAFAKLVKAL